MSTLIIPAVIVDAITLALAVLYFKADAVSAFIAQVHLGKLDSTLSWVRSQRDDVAYEITALKEDIREARLELLGLPGISDERLIKEHMRRTRSHVYRMRNRTVATLRYTLETECLSAEIQFESLKRDINLLFLFGKLTGRSYDTTRLWKLTSEYAEFIRKATDELALVESVQF